jgi:hypothetical protein
MGSYVGEEEENYECRKKNEGKKVETDCKII